MSEMTSSSLFFCTNCINAPFEEGINSLVSIFFIEAFNEASERSGKLLNRV